jgi:hypothetical protein
LGGGGNTPYFGGGFTGANNAVSPQQQVKTELLMTHDPYGKLPDVPLPTQRVKPLPTTAPVAKPSTPTASHYKLTPKSVKKLMIGMEPCASPSNVDIDQRYSLLLFYFNSYFIFIPRVMNELMSPQAHMKKLNITDEFQQILDSSRKQQKAVLRDMSNETSFTNTMFPSATTSDPEFTPYKIPQKGLSNSLSHSSKNTNSIGELIEDNHSESMEIQNQNPTRSSMKDSQASGSLSASFSKPVPVRAQPLCIYPLYLFSLSLFLSPLSLISSKHIHLVSHSLSKSIKWPQ